MLIPGSYIDHNWYKTSEAKDVMQATIKDQQNRKYFGIQATDVFWPAFVKQCNKPVMFQLQFWDAGAQAIKKYDHILPACKDRLDCVLFLFSYVDKSSCEDLKKQMSRITEPKDNMCKIIIGTKFDQHAHSEVSLRELKQFEDTWKLPVLRVKNVPVFHPSETRSELGEVAPILNLLCEYLWERDLILADGSRIEDTENDDTSSLRDPSFYV
ncbi:ciliogenesis and planar polarity effector 2-like isoform X2 [Tubulanus polymorphus]|uniref:ciliogenesis and planar polarity effector 2-like isoform X2 n=1 Tax=Tubulanus polymorphus TaxID=672921 RepID=UPI003DA391A9